MDSLEIIKYCGCGWNGIAHIKHSYEKRQNPAFIKYSILHTKSSHCMSCGAEIDSCQTLISNSDLTPEKKQDLGIKLVPLPHSFGTTKYKLTIAEDNFTIYSLDINDTGRITNNFRSKNRIECVGEIFYEIIICPIVSDDSFNIEYRITESNIDAFCEYFLEHFTVKYTLPKLPLTQPRSWKIPTSIPSPPNPYSPAPSFDPNQIPWVSPIPNKKPMPKKTDPYALDEDISDKYRKKIEEILRKQKDDQDWIDPKTTNEYNANDRLNSIGDKYIENKNKK